MEGGIWVCCFFFSLFVMLGEEGGSDEQRVSQGGGCVNTFVPGSRWRTSESNGVQRLRERGEERETLECRQNAENSKPGEWEETKGGQM